MKLISEHIEDVEYITEEKDNGEKTYKIKGVFMQSEVSVSLKNTSFPPNSLILNAEPPDNFPNSSP